MGLSVLIVCANLVELVVINILRLLGLLPIWSELVGYWYYKFDGYYQLVYGREPLQILIIPGTFTGESPLDSILTSLPLIVLGFIYISKPNLFKRWFWKKTSIAQRALTPAGYEKYMRTLGLVCILVGVIFIVF